MAFWAIFPPAHLVTLVFVDANAYKKNYQAWVESMEERLKQMLFRCFIVLSACNASQIAVIGDDFLNACIIYSIVE
jgi:hypothetical protein